MQYVMRTKFVILSVPTGRILHMSQRTYYSEEAERRAKRDQLVVVGVFLALGLSIGTAIAMLFAPQSGDETRRQLSENVEKQMKDGRKVTETAIERLERNVDQLRERMERLGRD
jgi:hypothetical protein